MLTEKGKLGQGGATGISPPSYDESKLTLSFPSIPICNCFNLHRIENYKASMSKGNVMLSPCTRLYPTVFSGK